MGKPSLEERSRQSRRGRSTRVREQGARGQLNQGATPDDGLESFGGRLEGRIALGMGEREPESLGRKLEDHVFESGGDRPVGCLEEEVAPCLPKGSETQILGRCVAGPLVVDLGAGYQPHGYAVALESFRESTTAFGDLRHTDAREILAEVRGRCHHLRSP